jgi:tRNA threonylcarbamoyladenosine biosynthesis protein TsaE
MFGQAIGSALVGGEVLTLIGDLGAGKTTLIRGIAAGLGVPPTSVSSPTFLLVHEYRGRLPLIHVDLYRLRTTADAQSIGLEEYLTGRTITVIEWADRFPTMLPEDRLDVHLAHRSLATRTVRLEAHGPRSRSLLTRLRLARGPIRRRSTSSRQMNRAGRRKAHGR